MSFGKMNTFINIISINPTIDGEGFSTVGETLLASVRAYKEERHGNERWANMATFSTASSLFRFRKIPGLEINSEMIIVCADDRYRILSSEDVRGRRMYTEVLTERIEPSMR